MKSRCRPVLLVLSVMASGCGHVSQAELESNVYRRAPSSGPRLEVCVPFEASLVVYNIAFSPDGQTLASAFGSADGVIALWDTRTGRLRRSLPVHYPGRSRSGTTALAYSPDGETLAFNVSAQTGKTRRYAIQLWDPRTGKLQRTLVDSDDGLSPVRFSPDGHLLMVDRMHKWPDSILQMWDVRAARPLWSISPYEAAALLPDGRRVVVSVATSTGTVETRLRDARTGKTIRRLPGEAGSARVAAISPDGRYMLGALRRKGRAGFDYEVALWDIATGGRVPSFGSIVSSETTLGLSPDGKTAAYDARGPGFAALREISTGATRVLDGQEGRANAVAFSADGTKVAGASKDGVVRLWDRNTGRLLVTMLMVKSAPKGSNLGDWIAFTPAGNFASTARAEAFMRWLVNGQTLPLSVHAKEYRSTNLIAAPPER
jgi:WD40 repeat protein